MSSDLDSRSEFVLSGETSSSSGDSLTNIDPSFLAFVTISRAGSSDGQMHSPLSSWIMSSNWIHAGPRLSELISSTIILEKRAVVPRSTAQALTEVREASGLTWEQLARYFGVSRRSVHLWAAGGRMSASNEELLAHLELTIESMHDLDVDTRRRQLLRSDNGLNIIDAERVRRASNDRDINRSPEIGVHTDKA